MDIYIMKYYLTNMSTHYLSYDDAVAAAYEWMERNPDPRHATRGGLQRQITAFNGTSGHIHIPFVHDNGARVDIIQVGVDDYIVEPVVGDW